MRSPQPIHYLWWLVSRASGVVALALVSLSVLLGLTMAAKLPRRPAFKRGAMRLHEHVAVLSLVAIALHGVALLGDGWLRPGLSGIAVPFAMRYRPQLTGVGIIAGYLAMLVGPSFYVRRKIGVKRWRSLHRATVVVWALSVVHTIGAGSDGPNPWLRAVALLPGPLIVYVLVVRLLQRPRQRPYAAARSSSERIPVG
jgi:sulfoxide reductase heme-binding subunit YedZ